MADRYIAIHQNPDGPGDARPTALQIIHDEDLTGKWTDKTILITGCSSGIGVETAKALHLTGATLYLTARDLSKAKSALGPLATSPTVHLLPLDLDSLASVRTCAATFQSQSPRLNLLICNAGVMNTPEGRTSDGHETQFGTNHLAHFLLINLLLPTLVSSTTPKFASRIIILSSIGHRWGGIDFSDLNFSTRKYDPTAAYAQSKTANLWTANELERRYGDQGVHAFSVQPGGVNTGLSQHMSKEEVDAVAGDPVLGKIFKSVEQGASTTVWAATAKALEGKGGEYLEDCHGPGPWTEEKGMWGTGYAPHANDPEGEKKLWEVSRELVGSS